MRLFELKDRNGNIFQGIPRANGALSFENKQEAKARRNELNSTKFDEYPFTVTPGRDHRNYKGKEK